MFGFRLFHHFQFDSLVERRGRRLLARAALIHRRQLHVLSRGALQRLGTENLRGRPRRRGRSPASKTLPNLYRFMPFLPFAPR